MRRIAPYLLGALIATLPASCKHEERLFVEGDVDLVEKVESAEDVDKALDKSKDAVKAVKEIRRECIRSIRELSCNSESNDQISYTATGNGQLMNFDGERQSGEIEQACAVATTDGNQDEVVIKDISQFGDVVLKNRAVQVGMNHESDKCVAEYLSFTDTDSYYKIWTTCPDQKGTILSEPACFYASVKFPGNSLSEMYFTKDADTIDRCHKTITSLKRDLRKSYKKVSGLCAKKSRI